MKKGILKKVKGKLKMAVACAITYGFMGVGLASGIAGVGVAIAYSNQKSDMIESFEKSQAYISAKEDDVEKLDRAFDAGEINKYEYIKKLEYMDSEDYRDEVLARDNPANYEYHVMLKKIENLKPIGMGVGFGGCGLAALGGVLFLTDVGDKLYCSGEEDLRGWRSYTISSNPPPKPKKKKKIEEEDEEGEEQLMDIEDYMAQFQSQE